MTVANKEKITVSNGKKRKSTEKKISKEKVKNKKSARIRRGKTYSSVEGAAAGGEGGV